MLHDLRSDDSAIQELRDAWHVYLEAHLSAGGLFPRTLLLHFAEEWTPFDRRQAN